MCVGFCVVLTSPLGRIKIWTPWCWAPLNFFTDLENSGSHWLKGLLIPHRNVVISVSDKNKQFFTLNHLI